MNSWLPMHIEESDALVVQELGLAHARRRVDVAVIGNCIHGYEIKSERDRLDRLPGQLEVYTRSLHRLTLVVANKHLSQVTAVVPPWAGILSVSAQHGAEAEFTRIRESTANPKVESFMVAHLLWRTEVRNILESYGLHPRELRARRTELYRRLITVADETKIVNYIRKAMLSRIGWRDHLLPS